MEQPVLKPHMRYIFYRVYAITALLLWNAIGIWEITTMGEGSEPRYLFLLIPFFMPALVMVFNLFAFPFRYSIFGRCKRRGLPNETRVLKQGFSWGRIGWLSATVPFFTWYVFPSGLGVSVLAVGRAFVPVGQMIRLSSGFFSGYKLWHTSPEVRSPIRLPNRAVFEAVQFIKRRYEEKGT